jgi:farnesyl diphosphate synthase
MGALVGGADAAALAAVTVYAEAAGRAFQLADDLLDVTATATAMGKATGKDAARGKQTRVARLGIEAARAELDALVSMAEAALADFGPEAGGLRATVRFFANREN